jgi:hypothetical protein
LRTRDPLCENVHLGRGAVAVSALAGIATGAFQRIERAFAPLANSSRA